MGERDPEDLRERIRQLSTQQRAQMEENLLARLRSRELMAARPAADSDSFPMSFAQQRLWFIQEANPGSSVYNVSQAYRIKGPLDLAALEQAFGALIDRHATLRTTFGLVSGEPRQFVRDRSGFHLQVSDVSDKPAESREAAAIEIIRQESRCGFDLSRDLMLRACVLRLGSREHVLLIVMHHIASDGWSMGILRRELWLLYQAFGEGREPELPQLPIQYTDFASWQRKHLEGEELERHLRYWRDGLQNLPPALELPSAKRPRDRAGSRGERMRFEVPEDLSRALGNLSRRLGVTMFMTLLAAWDILLSRYTGRSDIIVGSAAACRNLPEIEGLIGFFVNMLVLRTNMEGDPTVQELIKRVRDVTLGAYAHQELPFDKLVQELAPRRQFNRNPLFEVSLVFQNTPRQEAEVQGLEMTQVPLDSGTAKFDLLSDMALRSGSLCGFLEYDCELYDRPDIERIPGHLVQLMREMVERPEARVSSLRMITNEERRSILVDWNAAEHPPADTPPVQELYEAQVDRTPLAPAVASSGAELTYRQLDERANRLAHYLQGRGVAPGALVAICMERGLDMVVGLLGILKAGGAYVPLDPAYPTERLRLMLMESAPCAVLTQKRLRAALPECAGEVLSLDSDWDRVQGCSNERPGIMTAPEDLAYVIYTSGSSGQPKGVMIPHRALANHMAWMRRAFPLKAADRVLQKTPFSFDASVWEFFAPLTEGATLVMAPPRSHLDPAGLVRIICRLCITRLQATPTLLKALLEEPELAECRSLGHVFVGGEVLTSQLVERFFSRLDATLCNLYGPTEACIDATFWVCTREDAGAPVPIGRPISNMKAHVLDAHMEPLPVGVPGELFLSGPGLARGYLNRPELTAANFIPDLFSDEPGARLYRTGDLVRWRPDGVLEFLGRKDRQVKVRGVRVEPGEVEQELLRHQGVREAAVSAREDPAGSSQLVAYLVPAGADAPTADVLREFLAGTLPDCMIPSAFVPLSALPLTSSGKVDYAALPPPDAERPLLGVEYAAPRTDSERELAALWLEVLGVEKVGVHDNFFDLGGQSLSMMAIIVRMSIQFGVEVTYEEFFDAPTVADLAVLIDGRRHGQRHTASSGPPADEPWPAPVALSFGQQEIWFATQIRPDVPVYNEPFTVRFPGAVDPAAVEWALQELVRRHRMLRTGFMMRDGRPVQVVHEDVRLELPVVDLRGGTPAEREQQALRFAADQARQLFDMGRPPLLRVMLAQLDERDWRLYATIHHVLTDAWGIYRVLFPELKALYIAAANGTSAELPEPALRYEQFVRAQQERTRDQEMEARFGFWRDMLQGVPPLQLPTDRPRPAQRSFRGDFEPLTVPQELAERLLALARWRNATLYMVLLTAFEALLARYSRQTDFAVGTAVLGRDVEQSEGVLGYFVNVLALRTDLSGDPTFDEALQRVRRVCINAQSHRETPFQLLVERMELPRVPSRHPLFQVAFVMEPSLSAQEGWDVGQLDVHTGTSKFDLTLEVEERGGRVIGRMEYSADLFDRATVQRMLGHYLTLLQAAAEAPSTRLSALPMLTEGERERVTVAFNRTRREYPRDSSVHELFEQQVRQRPEELALVDGDRRMSYRALNSRANRLARRLRALGVERDVPVGVCMERSADYVVAILAALKAGGAYVPLDPQHPHERLRFMADDTGFGVLLTQRGLASALPRGAWTVVEMESVSTATEGPDAENLGVEVVPTDLAYIMYTSGSTGRPKGVEIPHRGVVRLIFGVQYVPLNEHVRTLALATVSFDASTFEIWGPLLHGGTCIVYGERVPEPKALERLITSWDVSCLWLTAGLFNTVIDHYPQALSSVRHLLTGGEALSVQHVRRALDVLPHTRLTNGYGPTESTTFATAWDIPRSFSADASSVPIGRPIGNTTVYILDESGQPLPVGVPGELHIGGDGLARGYRNRPELTAERFIPDPFSDGPDARLYRTGDLARWLPDGNIEFLGRLDDQVKIRGFRIEPGEIESVLRENTAVREAAVVAPGESAGEHHLAAFVVPAGPIAPTPQSLTGFLKSKLPDYMVPSRIVLLDALPLTPNGKVDRQALAARKPASEEVEYVEPRDITERQLVQIWQRVLERRVGADDDFFDLGGHSLLAVRLFSEIEQILGRKCPVATIFEAPTVRQLADVLRQGGEPQLAPVVPLRTSGNGLSFVCVASMDAFAYVDLAQRLGGDHPFYVLHPLAVLGSAGREMDVGRLADYYIDQLRSVRPQGPYAVGGMCAGGVLAYEVACRLRSAGQEVAMLALIDTPRPSRSRLRRCVRLGWRLGHHLRALWHVERGKRLDYLRQRFKLLRRRAAAEYAERPAEAEPVVERYWKPIRAAYRRMLPQYVPGTYPGRLTIFVGIETSLRGPLDPRLRWRRLAEGGAEVHYVPGDHTQMLRAPHVDVLARELLKGLDLAQAGGSNVAPDTPE